jgi:hypothetical protein
MHPLHSVANETVDRLKVVRLEAARLSAELVQAEYDLRLAQARVERGLIKKAGGEKSLGPTVEDRARIFVLALDADEGYRACLKRRDELALKLEEAKAEAASLRDRLSVVLATMRAGEGGVPEAPLAEAGG